MEAIETLRQVAAEVSGCTLCPLHTNRKSAVPGEGPADAEILFVGEGPGYYENEQGRPFVGAAGQFLDELLASIQLKRAGVFITNVVKCRPPGNRDPQPEEVHACTATYLRRQIEAINPRMIVTLGRFSMGLYLPNARISQVHGKPFYVKSEGRILVPMYHPAAALHQASLRSAVEADFRQLPRWIERMNAQQLKARAAAESAEEAALPGFDPASSDEAAPSAPQQLSLF